MARVSRQKTDSGTPAASSQAATALTYSRTIPRQGKSHRIPNPSHPVVQIFRLARDFEYHMPTSTSEDTFLSFSVAGDPSKAIQITTHQASFIVKEWLKSQSEISHSQYLIKSNKILFDIFNPNELANQDKLTIDQNSSINYIIELIICNCIVSIPIMGCGSRGCLASHGKEFEAASEIASQISGVLGAPDSLDYSCKTQRADVIRQAVFSEFAKWLGPAIKQKIVEAPANTLQNKQEIAKWVTGELRRYGLTMRWRAEKEIGGVVERRTYEAHIAADPGNNPREGRFVIRYKDEDGRIVKPLCTPKISVLLDHFDIMVDDPDRFRRGKWTDRIEYDGADRPRA